MDELEDFITKNPVRGEGGLYYDFDYEHRIEAFKLVNISIKMNNLNNADLIMSLISGEYFKNIFYIRKAKWLLENNRNEEAIELVDDVIFSIEFLKDEKQRDEIRKQILTELRNYEKIYNEEEI